MCLWRHIALRTGAGQNVQYPSQNVPNIFKSKCTQMIVNMYPTFLSQGILRQGILFATRYLYFDLISSSPIEGSHCFLEQYTLPPYLITGWFQEQIQV